MKEQVNTKKTPERNSERNSLKSQVLKELLCGEEKG